MKHLLILLAALLLSACAGKSLNTDRSELADARAAIEAARAADAERCAPQTMADAVGMFYWAAHELTEGIHASETAELIARSEEKAKEAEREAKEKCRPKPVAKPKPKPMPKVVEIISLDGVHFEHDSAKLTANSKTILDEAIATLQRRADIHVEVAAHTDSQGSDEYNQALSERRATSVMEYLTSHGIDAGRLTAKGYGETQPVATNTFAGGRAQNRRVELRVMK